MFFSHDFPSRLILKSVEKINQKFVPGKHALRAPQVTNLILPLDAKTTTRKNVAATTATKKCVHALCGSFCHSLLFFSHKTIAVDDDVWMQFFYRTNAIRAIIIA